MERVDESGRLMKVVASGILVILLGCVAACAPTRKVGIPQEWQVPEPRASMPSAPERQMPQGPAAQEPILRPTPEIRESEVTGRSESAPAGTPGESARDKEPQYIASMHLVDQANASLAQGDADQAITVLEQAIQVDVYNGEAFYSLARAWRIKGGRNKALEFASKAEILFQDEPWKLKQVYLFKADLLEEMNDLQKAASYRQKAARL